MKLIHKRALSLLLSTALVLTMLPVTAMAATTKNGVTYLDSNGSQSSADNVTVIDNGSTTLNSGWYMVDSGNVTIDQTVTVNGDVKLILADGASLTVNGTAGNNAGIYVTQTNSLTIYAQSIGSNMGKLTATGRGGGAGIGSATNGNSAGPSSGTISICGGRITATGGCYDRALGPGIGNVDGPSFGTISIYGGMVTASNGNGSSLPDIGSIQGSGDKILITGGTVVSNRSDSQVNLGVNTNSMIPLPTIVIDGGSFQPGTMRTPSWGSSPFINSAGNSVSLQSDELTIPGQANAAVSSISIDGQPYGNSVYTDGSGTLYLHPHAYNSTVPVVVTMSDGSKYWAAYQPTDFPQAMTLVNAAETSVFPGTATFVVYRAQDIKAYKWDTGNTFSGIRNGTTTLKQNQDYTVVGNAITIKKEYLATLPTGVTTLTFSGLPFADSTLKILVIPYPEYLALGDSIASGYGLPGYNPNLQTSPAAAYPSIVGGTLGLALEDDAFDGLDSAELLDELEDMNSVEQYSKVKTVTLSIGSNDILEPFLNIVADKLGCNPEDVSSTLADMFKQNPQALSAALSALDADDGTGLKNNADLNNAASGFSQNFQSIISAIKTDMPNAKIYVTNAYNPYEGIKLPYGTGILDLGGIADGYIRTLNSAFSKSSTDYTLVDTYSAFSQSLQTGTSLVNANLATFNFDPHPNADGHQKIANMILNAAGYTPTAGTVSTAINSLSDNSTPGEVANTAAQVLSLSPSEQAQLAPSQVAALERLLLRVFSTAPSVSAPDTTNFSGSSALPGAPTATGLALATYGASGATLKTTQKSPPSGIPGGMVAFDLTLTEGGTSLQIHSPLAFPVMITIPLPPSFAPQAGFHYTIRHTLQDGSSVPLPVTISGTSGHYTATFTTSSFSMFTLVGTPDGSSSGSSTVSSVTAPKSGVTPSTFVSDTNTDFSVNGAYQFKITSQNGAAPVLTVGTPGIFETQLVKTSGSDYYFQLTSIGKAGEKAGIYVNGVKMLVATVGTYVKSDTTGQFKVAKGKTYTFKLTADEKPTFVCGNSSVFLVKFLRQSGKDFFYQVTAIGKPGQTAGFYLNTAKKPVAAAAVA